MQLDSICRICLESGILKPLYTTRCLVIDERLSCAEMLQFCSDKNIKETDKFPQQICRKCISNLRAAYKFKRLCDTSNLKIINFLIGAIPKEETLADNNAPNEVSDGYEDLQNLDDVIKNDGDCVQEKAYSDIFRKGKRKSKRLKKSSKVNVPYFCEPCQKTFRNEKTHKERIHSERNPMQCERCAAVFLKPYSLTLHMRQHDNNLPHVCPHVGCGKAYAIPSMLKQHTTIHTDERMFICQYCSHSVRTKQQLMIHIRCRHTKEKIFKCSFCEKSFVSYHTKYNHEKRHKNVRDYHCKLCKKSFVYASNLVYHMLTHTGEKKFECRVCGTKFGRKGHRNDHEGNVHGVFLATEVSLDCVMAMRKNRLTKLKTTADLENLSTGMNE